MRSFDRTAADADGRHHGVIWKIVSAYVCIGKLRVKKKKIYVNIFLIYYGPIEYIPPKRIVRYGSVFSSHRHRVCHHFSMKRRCFPVRKTPRTNDCRKWKRTEWCENNTMYIGIYLIYINKKNCELYSVRDGQRLFDERHTAPITAGTGHVWKLEVCYYYYYADHRRLGLNIAIYLSIIHCSRLDTAIVILNIYIYSCVHNLYIYIYLCIIIIGTQQINLPHETVMNDTVSVHDDANVYHHHRIILTIHRVILSKIYMYNNV